MITFWVRISKGDKGIWLKLKNIARMWNFEFSEFKRANKEAFYFELTKIIWQIIATTYFKANLPLKDAWSHA